MSVGTKYCIQCKQTKPLLEFHKLTKSKDGLQCYCKECNKAAADGLFDKQKLLRKLAKAQKANTKKG